MKYIRELKLKKSFPFVYIHKRPETKIERIHREYLEVFNILPIVYMIDCFVKIKHKLKKVTKHGI